MTGEEMERAIEFLLQNQAKFDTRLEQIAQQVGAYAETQSEFIQTTTTAIQALAETQARTDERLRQNDERFNKRLNEIDERFSKRITELDEKFSERITQLDEKFSERLAQTDERLNRLADLVERHIIGQRDGSP